jgi:arylsulfatase A-like enzyme
MREIAIAAALTAIVCGGTVSAQTLPPPTAAAQRPNILLIVADDLGWSDLGAFGGNIDTPNLDRLALAGVRFTGFHTAPTCSPTRSMLMSGVDNHEAGLGTMAEMLSPNEAGHPGYEGYLNDRVASIAELMQQGGYHTLMAGKWHLGLTEERSPAARGFDRSFALLQGLGNHFGADQNAAWAEVEQAKYRQDRKEVRFPKGAYSTDLFADKLISFLGESAGTQKPFFAYLAFSAPHWPLQAPDVDIAKYKGRFNAGPEALRAARLERQKQLGLVPASVVAHPLVGVPAWSSLTSEQRAIEARKMEVYAAMVDRLDRNVGRVIDALRASGQLDNTLILFTADNGPEGNEIAAPKQVTDPATIQKLGIDNSLANIGRGNSYVGYGFAWAQAGSAPSWLVKGYTTEGGTRTVTFASGKGVAGGRVSGALLHVTDIAPTMLAEAGLAQPATYKGRAILPFEGRDLSQLLAGKADAVRTPDDLTAWELFDGRAIRQGDWKAVYLAPASSRYLKQRGDGHWQLFDLSKDPGETIDLADREPARLAALTAGWNRYAAAKGVVSPAPQVVEKSPAP